MTFILLSVKIDNNWYNMILFLLIVFGILVWFVRPKFLIAYSVIFIPNLLPLSKVVKIFAPYRLIVPLPVAEKCNIQCIICELAKLGNFKVFFYILMCVLQVWVSNVTLKALIFGDFFSSVFTSSNNRQH